MLSAIVLCLAFQVSDQKVVSPDDHARLAAEFLSNRNKAIPQDAKPYIRFLSYYHMAGHPDLDNRLKLMRYWINSIHFESDPEFPREVPGSNGLLYWIDLRDYGWTSAAWAAVASREPYFREPSVNTGPAEFIRQVIGTTQDPNSLHVVGLVRADWFFRETVELDRSPAYHDLLFARQRHPEEEVLTKQIIDHPGGYLAYSKQDVPAGRYEIEVTRKQARFVDFPKKEQDIEKLLGVDLVRNFVRQTGINVQHGAVVEGADKETSIVARHNRLIERTIGPVGYWYKTFDVANTQGKRDFAETLNRDFEFDAGEILFRLPAGGQAGILVNSKGDILTVADNRFAHDSSDFKLDSRVRTYGSCAVCHESGLIKPRNLIDDMMKAGVDIKFKDKKDARDSRAFFLHWEKLLEQDQEGYVAFLKRTSGMMPAENARAMKSWRDAYDAPVDARKAAQEIGVPLRVFLQAASRSTRARVLSLVQGMSIPRATWEDENGYYQMVKLLSAMRKP